MSGSTFARGVQKTVAIALETTEGVQSTAVGQLLRRVTVDLNQTTSAIESQEINPSQQLRDARQGPRQVSGTLSGQLSPASYSLLFAQLLRAPFVAGITTTLLTDTVATIQSVTGNLIINGPAEHFLTVLGFKHGDICRFTGLTGGPIGDNLQNLLLIGVTDNVLTFAPPAAGFTLWSSGESVNLSVAGNKLTTPVTGQTDQSFTIEQWYGDVSVSELFLGCKCTQISVNIPASGFATFQASFTGHQAIVGSTQVYPSALAVSTTTSLTATGGKLLYRGLPQAIITGFNIQIVSAVQASPVVGSYYVPKVFMGELTVRGSYTCLFVNDTMTADYLNEAEVELQAQLTTGPTAGAGFVSFFIPRAKLMSSTKNDSPTSITRSYNFTALEQINGGTGTYWDDTTVTIQDSLT